MIRHRDTESKNNSENGDDKPTNCQRGTSLIALHNVVASLFFTQHHLENKLLYVFDSASFCI